VWSTPIRVGDAGLSADARRAVDVGEASWVGARFEGTLFVIATAPTTRLTLPAGAALTDGCVAGLAPGAIVEVQVGAATPLRQRADGAGVVVIDPSATLPDTDGGVPGVEAGAMDASVSDAGAVDLGVLDGEVLDFGAEGRDGAVTVDGASPDLSMDPADVPAGPVDGGCACTVPGGARSSGGCAGVGCAGVARFALLLRRRRRA
jgi:hypothetical protein